METSRPRMPAGATSEIYMGERFEASPIAVPPMIRQRTKQMKFGARAFPIDVTTKIMAEIVSSHLRPKRSLKAPAPIAPNSTRPAHSYWPNPRGNCPTSFRLPWISKNGSKNGFAPPITTQS